MRCQRPPLRRVGRCEGRLYVRDSIAFQSLSTFSGSSPISSGWSAVFTKCASTSRLIGVHSPMPEMPSSVEIWTMTERVFRSVASTPVIFK